MKAFQINISGESFDYRKGIKLNLSEIRIFFEKKGYRIKRFVPQDRHICAFVSNLEISREVVFLKLATTKGISLITENEYTWNDAASSQINVPKNYVHGYYKNDLFYFITTCFNGKLLEKNDVSQKVDQIIELSESIMKLKIQPLPLDKYTQGQDHWEKFVNKAVSHFEAVPENVRMKYGLVELLSQVENDAKLLLCRPRHGDFTPWHMILTGEDSIGLIDGEHAMSQGVEYYDIAYFIQRVFAVWKETKLAESIYDKLIQKGYDNNKLKTVLKARTIGGFLDESLAPRPDYSIHESLMKWVISM